MSLKNLNHDRRLGRVSLFDPQSKTRTADYFHVMQNTESGTALTGTPVQRFVGNRSIYPLTLFWCHHSGRLDSDHIGKILIDKLLRTAASVVFTNGNRGSRYIA